MKKYLKLIPVVGVVVILLAAVGTTIDDFFLPGSQPGQSGNIESPSKCDNCHGGYDKAVEPAFNWRGSMMAQAMRDPLFLASLAIANQDAPDSGDLCIRCHAPDGWLNGRSTPTDGSALNNNDRQGVQCDFCHKLVKPTAIGNNPFPENEDYLALSYNSDQDYLKSLTSIIPPQSGNGMYIAHNANAKRGPFIDAAAKHQINYSPFHSQSDLCGICHDVSNPVFKKEIDAEGNINYIPDLNNPNKSFISYDMFPVERTFSEWKMSAYNSTIGVYSDVFKVRNADGSYSNVRTCQDCHMRDVEGKGANKRGTPFRHNLPLHDMTGGNTFVPGLVAQLYPNEVDLEAINAGVDRARFMLQNAATMHVSISDENGQKKAFVEIINETGHKLPSGYPEGRRIWIRLKAFDINGALLSESGAYNSETAILQKENEEGLPTKIYEAKLGMSEAVANDASANLGATNHTYYPGESFHFVLNNVVLKDNRIPPRGFTNQNFEEIQSPPVDYNYADGAYFDTTIYPVPLETFKVNVQLLYQTTSKEYIEFLKDENHTNNAGDLMYELWASNGKSPPIVMNEQDVYFGEPPVKSIAVKSVSFKRENAKGGKTRLIATVIVVGGGTSANVAPNAQVEGVFSGPTSTAVSGITDINGVVTFTTSSKKVPVNWCLEVTNIIKSGFSFDNGTAYNCEVLTASNFTESEHIKSVGVQVYPNPVKEVLKIDLHLEEEIAIKVEIYSFSGTLMGTLHKGPLSKGSNTIQWNREGVPDGSYIITISYQGISESKLILIN